MGGGFPGFGGMGGGMPGGFGGMPGMPAGMPDPTQMLEQLKTALLRQLASVGINLPPGISAGQALGGVVVVGLLAIYFVTKSIPFPVLLAVGGVAYAGKKTSQGQKMLGTLSYRAARLTGRPLGSTQLLIALCVVLALVGRVLYGGGGGGSSSDSVMPADDDAFGRYARDMYQQGYDDALAGLDPRPPRSVPVIDTASSKSSSSSGSSFGIGSLLRYAMVGSYIYKAGTIPGQGFSPQFLLQNLQANPMQAGMMLMMLSGSIF